MSPAKAMQAALRDDRDRQLAVVLRQVGRRYGMNAYHNFQAHIWWGWRLAWKPRA